MFGKLYFWNLLGAFLGVVVAGLLLLKSFGSLVGSRCSWVETFWDHLRSLADPEAPLWLLLGCFVEPLRLPWNLLGTFWDPLESLRSSLERQVALEAELWGHTKFYNKNKQISWSIRRKMKRWSPKLERQHHFFWKSLKTEGFLMILRVREPRAGGVPSPALENARTP